MLRRRRPPSAVAFVGEDEDPKKTLARRTRNSLKEIRALLKTLEAGVWVAVNPSPDVRSQEYSEYLTSKVQGLTIGWHTFRTITEGAFLATYGLAFNTVVVQLFWMISASSLLLYSTSRSTWLRIREAMCVWTNVIYGALTLLKIFHLVPRLPNENNYMFKHCFLTMADAAFSQTPVHKQYMVQFAEAFIRVIVWRRYNVLLDLSTSGVVAVSLAWQLWLVTFSAILQARHVSAFRVDRAAAAAGNSTSAAATTTAAVTTVAPSASVGTSALPSEEAAAGEIATTGAVQAPAPAAAAEVPPGPVAAVATKPVRRRLVLSEGAHEAGAVPAAGGAVPGPKQQQQQHQESCAPLSAGQSRYLRALRSVARGTSSYVLLAHQRRQSGGPQCATAQFYISSASPDMLPGNWRDKLATAIAEGAPGWQLANVCVRKGSLIVHLDLVYCGALQLGMEPTAPPAGQPLSGAAVGDQGARGPGFGAGAGDPAVSGGVWPPFVGAPAGGVEQAGKQVLDDYVGGMSAEALMELLGLPLDLPSGPAHPVAVQLGTTLLDLHDATTTTTSPPAAAAAVEAATGVTFRHQEDDLDLPLHPRTAAYETAQTDAHAGPLPTAAVMPPLPAPLDVTPITPTPAKPASEPPIAAAPSHPSIPNPICTYPHPLLASLTTALRPPPELSSPAYTAFLSARVGWLHRAYASCLVAACFAVAVQASTRGVNPLTLLLFLSAELLSLGAHGVMSAEMWSAWRAALVYVGVGLRTLQMAACTCGFLPHVLKDTDCVSGRWVQKVVFITTLQALCMQPPVRSFFLVRLPSLALCIYVHVVVCDTAAPLLGAMVQHVGWEACLFTISAWFQYRHLEAFHRAMGPRHVNKNGTTTSTVMRPPALYGGSYPEQLEERGRHDDKCSSAQQVRPPATDDPASSILPSAAATPRDVSQLPSAELLPQNSLSRDDSSASGPQPAVSSVATALLAAAAPLTDPLTDPLSDPTDVSVSSPVVAMAPRRAANLQLTFSCAPAVVDELQVVLRHINPASMSSGVHTAHAVRDITHALAAPIGAAAAPPHLPAPFNVDLTLVASPADMPGLVHVELWRGRRRLVSRPVLLASTAAAPAAVALAPSDVNILTACAARASASGMGATSAAAAGAGGLWLDDVRLYVEVLRQQGHESAADQFVEELGGWLAQAAALERGLIATGRGGSTSTGAIANVLYFHGFGSEFMYLKPRRVSRGGGGGGGGASVPGSAGGNGGGGCSQSSLEGSDDALQGTLRQLLLCQGSMLLAVAVEAAAVSLSSYLAGLMVGQLGAQLVGLLEGARTPVTQLPLMHAAVKSGSEEMVDLVAEWCTSCGVKDLWGQEAAIMAVALEAAGPGGRSRGNSANSSANPTASGIGIRKRRSSRSLMHEKLYDKSHGSGASSGVIESPFRFPEPPRRSGNGGFGGNTSIARNASRSECNRSSLPHEVSSPLRSAVVGSAADSLLASIPTLPHDALATESQPFKILDFRVSNRSGAASTGPRACGQENHHAEGPFRNIVAGGGGSGSSVSRRSMCVVGAGSGGVGETQHSAGGGSETGRSSLDLVGDAVLVLTPLHLALALGDGGRLAAHILQTYPEAFELWRASQGPQEAAEAAASALGPSYSEISHGSNILCPHLDDPLTATAVAAASGAASRASSRPSSGSPDNNPLKILGPAFASMPGLGGRARDCSKPHQLLGAALGIPGQFGQDGELRDSLDADSLQSMSLSEVAFLEGIRWVDEAPARRAGVKVTRM